MQPDIGIVRTDRQTDGLSTRSDEPNTLTCQSNGTTDTPWIHSTDPLQTPK